MNNKINTSELVSFFAEKSGLNKKLAENFIREFQKIIIEGLEKDKIVKINGLGTFKLVLTAERKSINVQTGETIIIPQHYKLTFIADNTMKSLINNPIKENPTDPLKKMAEQASEINDILKEFSSMQPSTSKEHEKDDHQKQNQEQAQIPISDSILIESSDSQKTTKKYRNYGWLIWLTSCCCLLMILGFLYYLYAEDIQNFFFERETKIIKIEEQTNKTEETDTSSTPSVFNLPIDYSQVMAEEIVRKGTRLSFFAKQYYGHPDFWIYIYQANKEIIDQPNNVLIGTKIKIPKLPAELIDIDNEKAIAFALELAGKNKNNH